MEFISKIGEDTQLTIGVLALLLVIILTIKYKKRLFYTVEGDDAQKHPLNSKYKLYTKKRFLDIDKINKELYTLEVVTTIICGIVMVMFDIMLGFLLYIIIMYSGKKELYKRIAAYYFT